MIMPERDRPASLAGLSGARSAADANLFDHPVVVAPVLDQFDMAAVMPVVAAIFATLVITELNAVLIVAILVVVVLPVMAANDDLAIIGLIVR